ARFGTGGGGGAAGGGRGPGSTGGRGRGGGKGWARTVSPATNRAHRAAASARERGRAMGHSCSLRGRPRLPVSGTLLVLGYPTTSSADRGHGRDSPRPRLPKRQAVRRRPRKLGRGAAGSGRGDST